MKQNGKITAFVLSIAGLLTACGPSNPVISAKMKQIKAAYQAAMATNDIHVLAEQAAVLRSAFTASRAEEPTGRNVQKYQAGMAEAEEILSSLDAAIAAGDVAQAKAALTRLNELRKKYHMALGV